MFDPLGLHEAAEKENKERAKHGLPPREVPDYAFIERFGITLSDKKPVSPKFTLDWFLALPRSKQLSILEEVREILKWSGWLSRDPLHGGQSIDALVDAVSDAGIVVEAFS